MTDWTMAAVADSYEFPTDLPADANGGAGALRWTATIIVLATGLLALTNAQSIRSWTEELPLGPRVLQLVAAANDWEAVTSGPGGARARLHRIWRGMAEARWTSQPKRVEAAQR